MPTSVSSQADAGIISNIYSSMIDDEAISKVGTELVNAQNDMKKAVESGNTSEALLADSKLKQAIEKYSMMSQMMKSIHEMIMSIIRNIG